MRRSNLDARRALLAAVGALSLALPALGGCAFLGGAAAGAGAAGAGYEYQNKKALDDLDEEYAEGKISREEYLRRRHEIDDHSVVY